MTSSGRSASPKVSSNLLADQVFNQLRAWITHGDWAPGVTMRIREVASLVGTSDMPVREAFRRLEQAGLIVVEPYRGARVPLLSIDELEHVYDVRVILEPQAALRGTRHAGADVVEAMSRHWSAVRAASDRGDIAEAVLEDEMLLTALYEASGNDILMRLIDGVWDSCRPYKSLWVSNAIDQGIEAWNHIEPLIAAVADHDEQTAFNVLDRTYQDARDVIRQLLTGHITGGDDTRS